MEAKSCFQQRLSHVLLALREGRVGYVGRAVAVQGFNDGGYGTEGCENAAGVDWRMVRDVVENSREGEIV